MKHFYCEFNGITMTYNDPLCDSTGFEYIPVYFEREDSKGDFDFAEGKIPQHSFQRSRGFSELELKELETFLLHNMLCIYRDAGKVI